MCEMTLKTKKHSAFLGQINHVYLHANQNHVIPTRNCLIYFLPLEYQVFEFMSALIKTTEGLTKRHLVHF